MKKIIFFIAMILALQNVRAQINDFVPYRSKVRYIGMGADSSFYIPTRDTNFIPFNIGFVTRRPQDSIFYVGIKTTAGGKHWDKFANWIGTALFDTTVYHSTNYHNTLYPRLSGSYANPSWVTSLAFSKITGLQDSIQKLRDSINDRLRTSQAMIVDTTGASNGWEAYIKRTTGQPDTIKFRAATSGGSTGSGAFSKLDWVPTDENAPVSGDSILVHDSFPGKYLDVYRDGVKQPHVVGDTGWVRVNDSTIKVKPPFSAADKFWHIEARDSSAYTQLTLQAISGPPATTIAYVSGTNGGNNGGSTNSRTFSHTTGSGSNRYLLVGFMSDVIAGDTAVTSVTYAGVAMQRITKLAATNGGARWVYLYGLANPTTGANNVVITVPANRYILAAAVEYAGVQGVDAVTTADAFTNSKTTSITTTANNCWAICLGSTPALVQNAGTGATKRVATTSDYITFFDSNGAITPAGSYSMTTTSFSGSGIGHIIVSLKPY